MTGVTPPLKRRKAAVTLVLGLSDEGILTAWDPTYHVAFTPGSSSLQTSRASMTRALTAGFGFHRKTSGEVTVSLLPELIMEYVNNQSALHSATTALALDDLQATAEEETRAEFDADVDVPEDEELYTEPLKTRIVRQAIRDKTFANRVIEAYELTCCMCGVQLGLVEAAHIVPLSSAANFSTRNGLALCHNHHTAYDSALVGVCEDYSIVVSTRRRGKFAALGRDGGRSIVIDTLLPSILVPKNPLARPAANYLREAMRLRKVLP
jgi:putative restriction endonuclease